jgi:hypothetical protein
MTDHDPEVERRILGDEVQVAMNPDEMRNIVGVDKNVADPSAGRSQGQRLNVGIEVEGGIGLGVERQVAIGRLQPFPVSAANRVGLAADLDHGRQALRGGQVGQYLVLAGLQLGQEGFLDQLIESHPARRIRGQDQPSLLLQADQEKADGFFLLRRS